MKAGGVITRLGSITRLRLPVVAVLPSESVTFTVNVDVPATVGVALLIVPLPPSDNGFGSVPVNRVNV